MEIPIENLLTNENPEIRKVAKKLRSLGFPVTFDCFRHAVNFWERIILTIYLPNGCRFLIGKYPKIKEEDGWYYKYVFKDERWAGSGDRHSFKELYEKVKFIIEDLQDGGKVSWGFWNHA